MNLANIRKEKGMSQASIADSLGVTSQAISNYELGIREPNIVTLKKLASTLGVSVDELLKDDPDDKSRTGEAA